MNSSNEKKGIKSLKNYLRSLSLPEEYIQFQIDSLFDKNSFLVRYNFYKNFVTDSHKKKLLVSGCSIGTEILLSKELGWKEVHGVEVQKEYVDICKLRIGNKYKSCYPVLYNGNKLPYDDSFFTMIISGHVIEHTNKPKDYLLELIRKLKKNGLIFIEFPTRYNMIELHTRVISYEWMPFYLRNFFLRVSILLSLSSHKKQLYRDILNTLSQVSKKQIRKWIKNQGEIIGSEKPAKGIIRLVIRKIK